MKYFYLCFFLFSNSLSSFSQNDINSQFIEPLQKDALLREKVYIHLNKSVYLINENIWFTAYIAEDYNNSPSLNTTNLHVNLLNEAGKIIDSRDLFINKGTGTGNFLIGPNLIGGKYYIHGYTAFMENFGKENAFVEEIEIVTSFAGKKVEIKENQNKYDVQVFPESGYLLEDTESNLGIKALINGKGFPFKGTIINSKNEVVASFTGNDMGMAKATFFYKNGENYFVELKINGTVQKATIPQALGKGVIFNLDNSNPEQLRVIVKTNNRSISGLLNKGLTIVFYRNNYVYKASILTFKNNKKLNQELFFDKRDMLNGVNIVTIFKDNEPIAERKFYVDKKVENGTVTARKIKVYNDSVYFKIKTTDLNKEAIGSQLSISTLPQDNKIFFESQNIKSAFLLSPYVKGVIENPAFYFKNISQETNNSLDLLLLNQGWIAYDLKTKIEELNPKKKFSFEIGYDIRGQIKDAPKGHDLALLSDNGKLIASSKLDKHNNFSLENIVTFKREALRLTLMKNKSPLLKPVKVTFIDSVTEVKNYQYLTDRYNALPIVINSSEVIKEEEFDDNFNDLPDVKQLDEIFLKAKRSEKTIDNIYDLEKSLAHKKGLPGASFYTAKKITQKDEIKFRTVFDYFSSIGKTRWVVGSGRIIYLGRGAPSIMGGGLTPRIYVDDVLVVEFGQVQGFVGDILMTEIDEILINASGTGEGMNGQGGLVRIYYKKGNHKYFSDISTHYEVVKLKTGYDRAQSYYRPEYNIANEAIFKWTEIDWKPMVITNSNGEAIIKIPVNDFSKPYQLIINGFSDKGLLLYELYKTE